MLYLSLIVVLFI